MQNGVEPTIVWIPLKVGQLNNFKNSFRESFKYGFLLIIDDMIIDF